MVESIHRSDREVRLASVEHAIALAKQQGVPDTEIILANADLISKFVLSSIVPAKETPK